MTSPKLGYDMVDLLPTEKTTIEELMVQAQRKFIQALSKIEKNKDLVPAIDKWAHEVEGRFRDVGFIVVIDALNIEEDVDGKPVFSPTISVTGKVEDVAFDYTRAQHEVQNGLLDGREGRVNANGLWLPPKKNLNG